MTSRDSNRRRPAFKALAMLSLGWGLAWAVGLTLVYNIDVFWGWTVTGVAAGAVLIAILRRLWISVTPRRWLVAYLFWLIGGGIAGYFAAYDVHEGWLQITHAGAWFTGFIVSVAYSETRRPWNRVAWTLAWLVSFGMGSIAGAAAASTFGKTLGILIGTAVGGATEPFLIWGVAWGIGGMVAGAIGGLPLAWQVRNRRISS